ncbi:unnamed protein product [Arctogadus glacialis]
MGSFGTRKWAQRSVKQLYLRLLKGISPCRRRWNYFKSSLTCPHCLKQSNTFDPFLCISLPIPLRHTSTRGQRYLRVGLSVPLQGSLAGLRRMVADEGHISPDQVILTEIYSTGFQRSFFDEDDPDLRCRQ